MLTECKLNRLQSVLNICPQFNIIIITTHTTVILTNYILPIL